MILAPRFVIGHIGRTGGDAIKQIVAALNLPEVSVSSIDDPQKHNQPPMDGRDLVLSIRRLPARELSLIEFFACRPSKRDILARRPGESVGELMLRHLNGERMIRRMTRAGTRPVVHLIRSEHLRSDLAAVLGKYYRLNGRRLEAIHATKTKPRLDYKRRLLQRFTKDEIARLYERSPIWSELERRVYGNLLIDVL
jgi:hypothetical protein